MPLREATTLENTTQPCPVGPDRAGVRRRCRPDAPDGHRSARTRAARTRPGCRHPRAPGTSRPHRCPTRGRGARHGARRAFRQRPHVDLREPALRLPARDLRHRSGLGLVPPRPAGSAAHPRLLGVLRVGRRAGAHQPPLRARAHIRGIPRGREPAGRRVLRGEHGRRAGDRGIRSRPAHRDSRRDRGDGRGPGGHQRTPGPLAGARVGRGGNRGTHLRGVRGRGRRFRGRDGLALQRRTHLGLHLPALHRRAHGHGARALRRLLRR